MKAKINLVLLTIILSIPLAAQADGFINGVKSIVRGVGQGVEDVATGVGNAAGDVGRGVGNAFNGTSANDNSDTGITNRVKNAIKDLDAHNQISSGYNLNVQTSNRVVNISGTVTNAADVNTIQDKVSSMNGVKSVNTQITE